MRTVNVRDRVVKRLDDTSELRFKEPLSGIGSASCRNDDERACHPTRAFCEFEGKCKAVLYDFDSRLAGEWSYCL